VAMTDEPGSTETVMSGPPQADPAGRQITARDHWSAGASRWSCAHMPMVVRWSQQGLSGSTPKCC
jgi:hypothetical protein